MKYTISVIIPVFNEDQNLLSLYQELTQLFKFHLSYLNYELIFIDDGSHDNSWRYLQEYALLDNSVKIIRFSRNFGYQAALTAGYRLACGHAMVTMDSDLQHPPEIIPKLIVQWRKGYSIVYARRLGRSDRLIKKATAYIYHKLVNLISPIKIPSGVSDFRLIDRCVVRALLGKPIHAPFWRGLIAWSGFEYTFVDFWQPDRRHGKTCYSWSKLCSMAGDGIVAFSQVPLRLAALCGAFVVTTGMLMLCFFCYRVCTDNVPYSLFKLLVIFIYLFMGVQFLLIWVLGEYIGRISQQHNNRPLYITREMINIKAKPYAQSDVLSLERT